MSKSHDQQTNGDTGNSLGEVYGKVTEKVSTAYGTALEKAEGAAGSVGSGIESNPFAALLGGLALGAIAGALLPRLEQEQQLLAPVGARIADAARAALEAGKTAGKEALDQNGLTTDALRSQVSGLFDQALKAAGAAGSAAAGAARQAASSK